MKSLSVAFPTSSMEERRGLARASLRHLGESLFELCWLPNFRAENLETTTKIAGLEHLQAAVDRGNGVVLFTGHCGNWEWMAATIGLSGFDMNVIAREVYDPRLNRFIVSSRANHGVKTIGRGSASSAREMLQTLRSGSILGVLIDQNLKVETVEVPFFGQPTPTPVGPAKLAIKSGAVAIAGFIERRDGIQHIRFEEPVPTSRNDDPLELTAQMTASIERQIRRVPEQWVWIHDRWRVRVS